MKYTDLMKFITATKNSINTAYSAVEAALMKRDETREKNNAEFDADAHSVHPKYTAEFIRQANEEVNSTYQNEVSAAVETCRENIKNQKAGYMEVVNDFYRPDGKQIDESDVALLNSGIPMTNTEIFEMVKKYGDNTTMLRIIAKYAADNNIDVAPEIANIFRRVGLSGSVEEKAFDRFVHFAAMGLAHPDEDYTLYQSRLGDYEEDARIALMKATIVKDSALQGEIEAAEQAVVDRHNAARPKNLDVGHIDALH